MRASETETDGGTVDGSIDPDLFTRVSDGTEVTRRDRLGEGLNRNVVVPLKILLTDVRGIVGFGIVIGVVLLGTVGSWLAPGTTQMDHPVKAPPFQSWEYPLGTDYLGTEVHLQIIHATPAMLLLVLSGALLSVVLGTLIGTVAGYKSGRVDYVLMMLSDTMLAIPALVLIIVLANIFSPRHPVLIGLILGINFWPGLARTVRSEVLSLREEAVIEAGRVMGLSDWRIIRKYIVSSLMPYISVNAAMAAQGVIFASVGLYFIGVLPSTQENWGLMMQRAYENTNLAVASELHWLIAPMAMLSIFTLGLILCGQALDRLFNVQLRARHGKTDEDDETETDGTTTAHTPF